MYQRLVDDELGAWWEIPLKGGHHENEWWKMNFAKDVFKQLGWDACIRASWIKKDPSNGTYARHNSPSLKNDFYGSSIVGKILIFGRIASIEIPL